jgi:adenosylhomocysteine nucleosidase
MELEPFLKLVEVYGRRRIQKADYIDATLRGRPISIVKCGIGPSRAANAIRNIPSRPSVILSVGTAGALVSELRIFGFIVSAETICMNEHPCVVTSSIKLVDCVTRAIEESHRPYHVGRLATVDRPVFTDEGRRRLHEETGAQAVDMESHSIAVEAGKLGTPFIAVRIISDDLNSSPLPERPQRKLMWRDPISWPRSLAKVARWALFLHTFRKCVRRLAPVLEHVVDEWNTTCAK